MVSHYLDVRGRTRGCGYLTTQDGCVDNYGSLWNWKVSNVGAG